jgi:hypothetical protein
MDGIDDSQDFFWLHEFLGRTLGRMSSDLSTRSAKPLILAVSQAIHPHQRIGHPTYGPAFSLARHRHVKRWQASRLAVAALPAKPTPWDMGAETPDGVWKTIRDTSSLSTRDATRESYGTCGKLSRS